MTEFIAALSILCCLAYIVLLARRRVEKKTAPFSGDVLAIHSVNVIYEDSEKPMSILFYESGFVLEHEGRQLPVAAYNMVSVNFESEFVYKVVFSPEKDVTDELLIEATEDIGSLFDMLLQKKSNFAI